MLQIYAISADGKTEVQLTNNLDHVNWCPYFHPSGKYFIWSGADYSDPARRNPFHLFTMELSYPGGKLTGGKVTQITDSDKTDVLPVFSPDGRKLMWTSTRTDDGSSQLFIGDWLRETGS
jgi:Tol biopolymer transport system component